MQVAGCRLQDAGCRMQVAGCRLQVAGRGVGSLYGSFMHFQDFGKVKKMRKYRMF